MTMQRTVRSGGGLTMNDNYLDVTAQIRLWHPLVLYKFVLSQVALVQNYCKRCGKEAEPFTVPDSIWGEVVGENGRNERCLRCFHNEAESAGFNFEWSVNTEDKQ